MKTENQKTGTSNTNCFLQNKRVCTFLSIATASDISAMKFGLTLLSLSTRTTSGSTFIKVKIDLVMRKYIKQVL